MRTLCVDKFIFKAGIFEYTANKISESAERERERER
jgi:hypothetical protein